MKENRKKKKRKKVKLLKTWDKIFFLVLGCFVIGGLVVPPSGKLALLNESMSAGLLLTVSIYPLLKLIKVKVQIKNKFALYIMPLFMFVVGLWISFNIVCDVIEGPKKVTLKYATVYVSSGKSSGYRLNGILPDDKNLRITLSSKEYKYFRRYAGSDSRKYFIGEVTITYYVHTNCLYDY